jgi:hypothetical protein
MARELVARKALEGISRTALVGMLGAPDAGGPGDEGTRWFLGYVSKGLFDETLWLDATVGDDGAAHGVGVSKDWYDPHRR